jgi:ribosomal protein S18 acetylase RimI-like enzyme
MRPLDRAPLDPSRLMLQLLTREDLAHAADFACGVSEDDRDLDNFLRDDALRLHEKHAVTTCVAYYGEAGAGALVGYVSFLTDAIKLESREKKKLTLAYDDHPYVSAIKVARLAVHADFRRRFRGTGEALMRFACGRAIEIGESAACRLLTVDAYPASVGFYERLGFRRSRAKEYADRPHPSMWLDLYGREASRLLSGVSGPAPAAAPAGDPSGG